MSTAEYDPQKIDYTIKEIRHGLNGKVTRVNFHYDESESLEEDIAYQFQSQVSTALQIFGFKIRDDFWNPGRTQEGNSVYLPGMDKETVEEKVDEYLEKI